MMPQHFLRTPEQQAHAESAARRHLPEDYSSLDEFEADMAARDPRAIAADEAKATEGWTPLEFYAYIVRSLGLPARFHFDGKEWVGEGPFTRPVPPSILELLEAQGV